MNAACIALTILASFNFVGHELTESYIKLCLCDTYAAAPELVDATIDELCDAGYLAPTVTLNHAPALVLTAEGARA